MKVLRLSLVKERRGLIPELLPCHPREAFSNPPHKDQAGDDQFSYDQHGEALAATKLFRPDVMIVDTELRDSPHLFVVEQVVQQGAVLNLCLSEEPEAGQSVDTEITATRKRFTFPQFMRAIAEALGRSRRL